jgi:thiopurine S-methyltransferase
LQPGFWRERWRTGQIGFHLPAVHPQLVEHWPELGLAANSRVLVPLCGKSLDLLWLQEQGHSVAGVELSAGALEVFCLQHGVFATRRAIDGFDIYEAERLELFRGDFFQSTRDLLGTVSAVYDRASLIAWPPDLRAPYVAHLASLTPPGAQTLLITLEYPQEQFSGPPFSVSADEVERLYSSTHTIQELSRQDILQTDAKMRSRGLTRLQEVSYRLHRR